MPEGDTLFRIAKTLRPILADQTVREATRGRDWNIDAASLGGRRVVRIETRGKHLLVHLDDQRVIHSHLGMTGSWHVYRPNEPWNKPPHRAALVLRFDEWVVICFTPKTLELLTPLQLRQHRYLNNLGPDLLDPEFNLDEAVARYRSHGPLPIGEAVMNQQLACGIGNEYKSEILFLERINPFTRVEQLTDDVLRGILERARQLMHRNLRGGARQTRFGLDGGRVWAYGRLGQACYRCGERIQMRRQGDLGRSTYWCPACQASDSGEPAGSDEP